MTLHATDQELTPDEERVILSRLEQKAERVVTLREAFDYGFKAGLAKAGLAKAGLIEHSEDAYKAWLWSRE